MKLVTDWRRVLSISFSVWMQVIGVVALIAPEVLFATTGIDLDPRWRWWAAVGFAIAGVIGRVVKQTDSKVREATKIVLLAILVILAAYGAANARAATEDETMKVALPVIAEFEGLRLDAYLDVVGVPTICYGSTSGVRLGQRKTKAECDAMLRREVAAYRLGWHAYLTADTIVLRLPPTRDAAYTSLAYNVGIRAAGRSTATRRLNAGDVPGGCTAIGWWNKAGGRVILGLSRRRGIEVDLCMEGL